MQKAGRHLICNIDLHNSIRGITMAVIKELIRTEADGSISFGNYELASKTKLSDFEHEGDLYKVKTFSEITRLERNEMFVYESVPGTAVTEFKYTAGGLSFSVEGPEDAQITVEGEPQTEYSIVIDGNIHDEQRTNLGGKLSFGVALENADAVKVDIIKK